MAQTYNCLIFIIFAIFLITLHDHVNCQNLTLANVTEMLAANRCYDVSRTEVASAISRIKLRFQYGMTAKEYLEVPLDESTRILSDPHYDNSTCFVLYISGWAQGLNGYFTKFFYTGVMEYCNCNMIMVNWISVTGNSYTTSVGMTPVAAKAIAQSLDALIDAGAQACYLTGLSLGGQCVGMVGRNMKNPVKHIIAFDPAGPLFYPPLQCISPISADDADCVEVIHTDSGFLGASKSTGTVDYWVNGGSRIQPNCVTPPPNEPRNICSHTRSQYLFLESLQFPKLFVGRLCSSMLRFLADGCPKNPIAYIGLCNNKTKPGDYFLTTSSFSPYGIGIRGANPGIRGL